MNAFGTRLFTWLKGQEIGRDAFGNRYYQEKKGRRRWVLYAHSVEGSNVPPEWQGWLTHTFADPPTMDPAIRPWQKPHMSNLTGTDMAYRPPGHMSKGGKRAGATGDYEPWRPD